MSYPSGGQLGCGVHRGYKCFDNWDCNNHVARPLGMITTNLLVSAEAESD
jgi:hypothetical protein